MKHIDRVFGQFSENLEDAFFISEDKKLLERLKKLQLMADTKENLKKVSGIHNDALLNRLVELDVKPEMMACIALVPLIEVAWADGEISPQERTAIERAAAENGFQGNENNLAIISQWLTHAPGPRLLKAWQVYIHGLCEMLTEVEKNQLREELLGKAKAVAASAGGFLGLMKISSEEQDVLDKLAESFSASK